MATKPDGIARHTPGPWVADGFADCQLITKDVPVAIGRPIGIARVYSPDMVADARLIAAAPDMLLALTHARDSLARAKQVIGKSSGIDMRDGLIEILDAAIAKAVEA